jgi:hypothetical protein
MNTLRKVVGKTRLDHVRNQDIREQCGIQPIGEWVNKRRKEWNNHISRMTEDSIVRAVRDNSPKGKGYPVSDGLTLNLCKQSDTYQDRKTRMW